MSDYEIEIQDPVSGNYVVVTAQLYSDGCYETDEDESGYYAEILSDPEFYNYTFEDQETGAIGIMPEPWRGMVDEILCNIYWDREFSR